MKKAKPLLAIWLALVLTLTLFPTALATDGDSHTLTWAYDPTHITVNDSATTSVTEGTDFTFSFTIASGYEFSALSVAIAGNDDYVTSAPSESAGTYSYTIAGAELTGDVTISITAAPEASTATEYTVTYDVNGGDALTSSTVQVAVGDSVTLPTPTYADHTFLGWLISGTSEDNGQTLSADTTTYTPTADVTLTAQWAQNVTVPYSQNGDTSLTGTGYVNQTDYVIEEPNVDAPDGQVFTGWLSSADNTTVYQPGDTITLTADLPSRRSTPPKSRSPSTPAPAPAPAASPATRAAPPDRATRCPRANPAAIPAATNSPAGSIPRTAASMTPARP